MITPEQEAMVREALLAWRADVRAHQAFAERGDMTMTMPPAPNFRAVADSLLGLEPCVYVYSPWKHDNGKVEVERRCVTHPDEPREVRSIVWRDIFEHGTPVEPETNGKVKA